MCTDAVDPLVGAVGDYRGMNDDILVFTPSPNGGGGRGPNSNKKSENKRRTCVRSTRLYAILLCLNITSTDLTWRNIMICPNCGCHNDPSSKFCKMCGMKIESPMDSVHLSPAIGAQEERLSFLEDPYEQLLDVDLKGRTSIDSRPQTASAVSLDTNNDIPVMSAQDLMLRPVYPVDDLRICSECGAIVQPTHTFCGECGAKYVDLSKERLQSNLAKQANASTSISALPPVAPAPIEASFELQHLGDDGDASEKIPLYEGENIIGQNSSVQLAADSFISPNHLKITCKGKTAVIEDNHSLNGVFFRFRGATLPLHSGDTIRIGEELLMYMKGNSRHRIIPPPEDNEDTKVAGGREQAGWGYLRVIMGAYSEGSVFRLSGDSVSIGRTRADILFERDSFVSGTHAKIQRSNEVTTITDLDSSNGTFLRFKNPLIVKNETTYILIGNQLLKMTPIPT